MASHSRQRIGHGPTLKTATIPMSPFTATQPLEDSLLWRPLRAMNYLWTTADSDLFFPPSGTALPSVNVSNARRTQRH